ncbi:MAG TPA: cysteine desulfurase family protein [Caulobacteraceae bacterium]|jgi:cysteine desulfurase|nr:cysteine desulfurase family protein [Caulobacteraceae bacterium]
MSVYLDYNATAPVRPEAAAAVARALEIGGNPSSVHAAGRAARAIVESARADVARLVGALPASVVFTSGGTEANALAIESAVRAGFERIIVGATEHDAVLEGARATGLPLEIWPVDARGVADLDWLAGRLAPRTLVCLMLANNETGVLQPVAEASALVREAGGWLHADAVQAAGKIAIDFKALGADTLALSAHKIGGPQGVGALVAGSRATLSRRLHGGGQERGRRAGTENVPGIAGFGAAAKLADLAEMAAQAAWRDAMAAQAMQAGAVVLGEGAARLPQTLCFAAEGFGSELQVMGLDLAGVMVSAGAACSSGKVKPSRVIEAMGRADLAPSAIRISGGWASTAADWARTGEAWTELFIRHQARRRASAAA